MDYDSEFYDLSEDEYYREREELEYMNNRCSYPDEYEDDIDLHYK